MRSTLIAAFLAVVAQSAGAAPLALPAQYTAINSGWHLNVRCGFLSGPDAATFAANVGEVDAFADDVLPPGYASHLRAGVQDAEAAATCGEADLATVLQGLVFAQEFVAMLNGPSDVGAPASANGATPLDV